MKLETAIDRTISNLRVVEQFLIIPIFVHLQNMCPVVLRVL